MVAGGGVLSSGRYHRPDAQAPDLVARLPRHRRARTQAPPPRGVRHEAPTPLRQQATIPRTSFAASSPSRERRSLPRRRSHRRRPSRTGGPTCTSRAAPRSTTCATPRRSSPWWPTRPRRRRPPSSPSDSEASELLGAVQALSAQVGGLQAELHALRSQVRPLPEPADAPGWGDSPSARRESSPVGAHARATGAARPCCSPAPDRDRLPRRRRASRPRSRSSTRWSSCSSWPARGCSSRSPSGSRRGPRGAMASCRRRRCPATGAFFGEDPSWFGPPVEHTAIDAPAAEEDDTQTRLPAPAAD